MSTSKFETSPQPKQSQPVAPERESDQADKGKAEALSESLIHKKFGDSARVSRAATGQAPTSNAGSALGAAASSSTGSGLPGALQGRLETSLGADLSGVRVHTGGAAAGAAGELGARAFTVGQDVHFGRGEYSPGSRSGDQLIAHEVAHTVQQQGGQPSTQQASLEVSHPADSHEGEAHAFADSFVDPGREPAPVSRGGASQRIAAWWADGHREITFAVGRNWDTLAGGPFHPSAIDYMAGNAGSQDLTVQSVTNFAYHLKFPGNKSPKQKESFEEKIGETRKKRLEKEPNLDTKENVEDKEHNDDVEDPMLRKNKEVWDSLKFHHRQTSEMPLHGEGGGYRVKGGDSTNAAAVTAQINEAATSYKGKDHKVGLLKLSDALHSAEDRGSHGEGNPWSGHDPRLLMEYKWDGSPNENYVPGWDCDNPAVNAGGRVLGEAFADQAYSDFWEQVKGDEDAVQALSGGKGGKGRKGYKATAGHGFRWSMGGMSGGTVKKEQDVMARVDDPLAYEQTKEENTVEGEETSVAKDNMFQYVLNGGFARDIIRRMELVTGGKMESGKYEKKFLGFTKLANAAGQFRWWCQSLIKSGEARGEGDGELVTSIKAIVAVLDKIEKDAKVWSNTDLITYGNSTWKRQVNTKLNSHQSAMLNAGKQVWPEIDPKYIETVEEEGEGGGGDDGALAKKTLASAKKKAIHQSQLIVRELSAGSRGPAYLERKEGHYTRLLGCAKDYSAAAEVIYQHGDQPEYYPDSFHAGELVKFANDWIKRASTSRTTKHSKRVLLGKDVLSNLTRILGGLRASVPDVGKVVVPNQRQEEEEEPTHEDEVEGEGEVENQGLDENTSTALVARGRVMTQARRIQQALHKADRMTMPSKTKRKLGLYSKLGPAYLEKQQGLYSALLSLAKEWELASKSVLTPWAIHDENLAKQLARLAKGWVTRAKRSGVKASKKDRAKLRTDILRNLGGLLGFAVVEGTQVEEDEGTDELKSTLQTHITFIMTQLELGTIGPAYMEKRWGAYSKLKTLSEEVFDAAKDPAVKDTCGSLIAHAEDWAKRGSTRGKYTRSSTRDNLKKEVVITLGGISL